MHPHSSAPTVYTTQQRPNFLYCVWEALKLAHSERPTSSCPRPALPCPALPCPALPCPALPCPAPVPCVPCPALPSCLPFSILFVLERKKNSGVSLGLNRKRNRFGWHVSRLSQLVAIARCTRHNLVARHYCLGFFSAKPQTLNSNPKPYS